MNYSTLQKYMAAIGEVERALLRLESFQRENKIRPWAGPLADEARERFAVERIR